MIIFVVCGDVEDIFGAACTVDVGQQVHDTFVLYYLVIMEIVLQNVVVVLLEVMLNISAF